MTVKMGSMEKNWKASKDLLYVTICVTEDCNLACKYCYCISKNNKNKLDIEMGYKIINYILKEPSFKHKEALLIDFIGGEPTLEIELIEKLIDYLIKELYIQEHRWFGNLRILIGSNGLNYGTEKVQKFINKYGRISSFAISLDGTKEKHDMARIKKDGSGSYDDIIKNVNLWHSQYPSASTKATFSHDDLPYLKDSIIHLWEMGIYTINANIVFEDVWEEKDDLIFEKQLKLLADYIIENHLWEDYSVLFFRPDLGIPLPYNLEDKNICGTGKSIAINTNGDIFSCHRFFHFTQKNGRGFVIGNIYDGLNKEKMRPLQALNYRVQNSDECRKCEISNGCGWCTGFNYSDQSTIYQRTTYHCKMHKANVRANEYFWERYSIETGMQSPLAKNKLIMIGEQTKFLYIINSSKENKQFCYYQNNNIRDKLEFTPSLLKKCYEFAKRNNFIPVLLGKNNDCESISYQFSNEGNSNPLNTVIVRLEELNKNIKYNNIVLSINKYDIKNIYNSLKSVIDLKIRINIVISDLDKWDEISLKSYEQQINCLVEDIINNQEMNCSFNILYDLMKVNRMINCNAGITSFAVAPNEKIYICPAFYFNDKDNYIGDIQNGIKDNINCELCDINRSVLCSSCDNYTCKRCVYLNKKITGEYTTPSSKQCILNNINKNASVKLQEHLIKKYNYKFKNVISKSIFLDPLDRILGNMEKIIH